MILSWPTETTVIFRLCQNPTMAFEHSATQDQLLKNGYFNRSMARRVCGFATSTSMATLILPFFRSIRICSIIQKRRWCCSKTERVPFTQNHSQKNPPSDG